MGDKKIGGLETLIIILGCYHISYLVYTLNLPINLGWGFPDGSEEL
jgi:hypothetical protein